MSPKAVYRGVLASAAMAGVVAIALSFALEDRLPPPLTAWAQEQDKRLDDPTASELAFYGVICLWMRVASGETELIIRNELLLRTFEDGQRNRCAPRWMASTGHKGSQGWVIAHRPRKFLGRRLRASRGADAPHVGDSPRRSPTCPCCLFVLGLATTPACTHRPRRGENAPTLGRSRRTRRGTGRCR